MLNDLDISKVKHVYLKPGRTDLRKGIDGLAAIVRSDLGLDPVDGSLFLFCGTRADRIKCLLYEGDGYVLLYKRASDGRFQWPRDSEEAMMLDQNEYKNLMLGIQVMPGIHRFKPTAY